MTFSKDGTVSAVIFRGTTAGITEDGTGSPDNNASNDSRVVMRPQNTVDLVSWSWTNRRYKPSLPAPEAEAAIKPDTGFEGLRITLNCMAHKSDMGTDPSTRTADDLNRLLRWNNETQTISGVYDEGRVGLWFWPHEAFSHRPVRNAGYKIIDVSGEAWPQEASVLLFTVVLEFSGRIQLHDGQGATE